MKYDFAKQSLQKRKPKLTRARRFRPLILTGVGVFLIVVTSAIVYGTTKLTPQQCLSYWLPKKPTHPIHFALFKSTTKKVGSAPKFDFYSTSPQVGNDLNFQLAEKKSKKILETTSYVLQVAAFQREEDANHFKSELALMGYEVFLQNIKVDNAFWYRVLIGPFDNSNIAQNVKTRLADSNINSLLRQYNPKV